jgi:hypothetical protein
MSAAFSRAVPGKNRVNDGFALKISAQRACPQKFSEIFTISLRENSFRNQGLAEFYAFGIIDSQDVDRDPSARRFAGQSWAVPREMIVPRLPPGVEQGNDLSRLGIDPGDVGALLEIATGTCESKVLIRVVLDVVPS